MKKIKEILFDMDGVLLDLEAKVSETAGKPIEEMSRNEVHRVLSLPGLYTTFPVMEGAYEMLDFAFANFKHVSICSSTGHYDQFRILIEKSKSLQINFSKYEFDSVNFVRSSKYKANFATPETLLIDDRLEKSVMPFIKAGGEAVYHTSAQDTLEKLLVYVKNNG